MTLQEGAVGYGILYTPLQKPGPRRQCSEELTESQHSGLKILDTSQAALFKLVLPGTSLLVLGKSHTLSVPPVSSCAEGSTGESH